VRVNPNLNQPSTLRTARTCARVLLCTTVLHNKAQNSYDILFFRLILQCHCSVAVYWRGREVTWASPTSRLFSVTANVESLIRSNTTAYFQQLQLLKMSLESLICLCDCIVTAW